MKTDGWIGLRLARSGNNIYLPIGLQIDGELTTRLFAMRVLITGAAGFLGLRLVDCMAKQGISVRCLIRRESDINKISNFVGSESAGLVEFEIGSVLSADICQKITEGVDVVIHSAAAMGGSPASMVVNNVVGSRNIMDSAIAADVSRFVLVSSIAVCDVTPIPKFGCFDESSLLDSTPEQRDPYCYSKVKQEEAAWAYYKDRELPLVVVRPAVLYGPGKSILSSRVGLQYGSLLFRVGGNYELPYSFVSNCADAVCAAALTTEAVGKSFNIIDSELPTGKQLVRLYKRRVGKLLVIPIPYWLLRAVTGFSGWYHRWSKGQLPEVFDKANSYALWKPLRYSNKLARETLGWAPSVGLNEGLDKSIGELHKGS